MTRIKPIVSREAFEIQEARMDTLEERIANLETVVLSVAASVENLGEDLYDLTDALTDEDPTQAIDYEDPVALEDVPPMVAADEDDPDLESPEEEAARLRAEAEAQEPLPDIPQLPGRHARPKKSEQLAAQTQEELEAAVERANSLEAEPGAPMDPMEAANSTEAVPDEGVFVDQGRKPGDDIQSHFTPPTMP